MLLQTENMLYFRRLCLRFFDCRSAITYEGGILKNLLIVVVPGRLFSVEGQRNEQDTAIAVVPKVSQHQSNAGNSLYWHKKEGTVVRQPLPYELEKGLEPSTY